MVNSSTKSAIDLVLLPLEWSFIYCLMSDTAVFIGNEGSVRSLWTLSRFFTGFKAKIRLVSDGEIIPSAFNAGKEAVNRSAKVNFP